MSSDWKSVQQTAEITQKHAKVHAQWIDAKHEPNMSLIFALIENAVLHLCSEAN